jgi:hypothetical protein
MDCRFAIYAFTSIVATMPFRKQRCYGFRRRHHAMRVLLLAASVAALGLPGCSTITTGPNQSIAVATEPAGATCQLSRDGAPLAIVQTTPGSATVSKSGHDIAVDCSGPQGLTGAAVIPANRQAETMANIALGPAFLLGYAIDLGTGAANEYPRGVRIWLDGPSDARTAAPRRAATYLHNPRETIYRR